jgi:hypothetical protein
VRSRCEVWPVDQINKGFEKTFTKCPIRVKSLYNYYFNINECQLLGKSEVPLAFIIKKPSFIVKLGFSKAVENKPAYSSHPSL